MKKQTLKSSAFLIIIGILLQFELSAQTYENKVFKPGIRTVELYRTGTPLSPPVINFNSGELLTLAFDDLEAGYQSWQYTFIHCNADWTPTDLWQNEYLNGYTDDYIRDYSNSFNTLQPYTHYSITIPNDNISFKIPGNYIVKVYPEGDPDNPILTRKIFVVDKRVSVKAAVRQAMSIENRFTHQEVNFSVFNPTYNIDEPYSQLKVVILQNFRWDNAIVNAKPLMLRSGEIDYQYTDGTLSFEGTNEFRYVDLKNLRSNTERIRSIEIRNDKYIVDLLPDLPRPFKPYITLEDINGRFLVRSDYGNDASNEGEYAWVNFFVPYDVPFPGGTLFVVGQFNDWRTDKGITPDLGRMTYNFARQGYEARVLLKQGYYNYMYAYADDKKGGVDLSQIEGNHSETSNQYTILVYNREQGYRYDRLIAVEFLEK
ncbi:MAG TPA: DUF5103 domain-containing protein [Lentimicrobium sp.]|nr:DUF5103 domain-containing protein [Lentimicrobium sp.]